MEPALLLTAVGAVRRVAVGTMRVTLLLGRTIGTLLPAALLASGLRSGAILTGTVVAIFATLAFETAVRLERP